MWKLILFFILLHVAVGKQAAPHGRSLMLETPQNKQPNTLGLINKTQDEVDAFDDDLKEFLVFLRDAKKRIVYKKELESEENIFYNIDVEKVAALGIISFASNPIKTSFHVVDFSEFQPHYFGHYLPCGKTMSIFIPKLFNIYNETVEHFSIEAMPDEAFFYDAKTLIAVTGNTHHGCVAPEVFVPNRKMMVSDAKKSLKKLSEDYAKQL